MSARTQLVELLTAGLDPDRYAVVGSADVPDTIDVGRIAVRAWQTDIAPGPQMHGLTLNLVIWALSPKQTPGAVDDDLDEALEDVLGVLYPAEQFQWKRAERGVMQNDDYAGWHGYRFDITTYATIEQES